MRQIGEVNERPIDLLERSEKWTYSVSGAKPLKYDIEDGLNTAIGAQMFF
jgi:hypothetical protein